MDCRHLLIATLLVCGACADAPPVVEFLAQATESVVLAPSFDIERDEDTHYRWDLIETPPGSVALSPAEDAPVATFTPDLRGYYLIERWVDSGISSDLSHRVVVHVAGVPPRALATLSPGIVHVGQAATLDGTTSTSPEHLALSYRWRLASRPAGSASLLSGGESATTGLTPDVVGTYVVELDVFDGELWSVRPFSATVQVFAP